MQVINDINTMRKISLQHKANSKTIALIPTMGNLHAGHLSLVTIAKEQADIIIVSIFVNPSQFGPNEDYKTYPRTLENDITLLDPLKVDYVFCPDAKDIYPNSHPNIKLHCLNLETILCGKTRPQFFGGVLTIIAILFNIITPDYAVFGEKDYQQLLIIKQLVTDLHYGVKIISGPIIREASGLAMSSRNGYLNKQQLLTAALIFNTLKEISNEIILQLKSDKTILPLNTLLDWHKRNFSDNGFVVDYLTVCDSNDLSELSELSEITKTAQDNNNNNQNLIILAAVYLEKIRLIDNIKIN